MNVPQDEAGEDASWYFGSRYDHDSIEAFLKSADVADDLESSQDDATEIAALS